METLSEAHRLEQEVICCMIDHFLCACPPFQTPRDVLPLRVIQTGGFQTGGFPDLDLSFLLCPVLSFLGLSRFFRDFPDLLGDGPGIFPIRLFSLSRPIKSTYEEQSATQSGPFPKKVGNPPVWKHPGLASFNPNMPFVRCLSGFRRGTIPGATRIP